MISLTQRDHELILVQCIHQNATTRQEIEGFTQAFLAAKVFAYHFHHIPIYVEIWLEFVHMLSTMIDDRNEPGWRTVVAYFKSGKRALDPALVPGAMRKWAIAFTEGRLSSDAAFKEVEDIHPLFEGNGRLGHLVWMIKRFWEIGIWPQELPPDMFDEENPYKLPYISSFGEIEDY